MRTYLPVQQGCSKHTPHYAESDRLCRSRIRIVSRRSRGLARWSLGERQRRTPIRFIAPRVIIGWPLRTGNWVDAQKREGWRSSDTVVEVNQREGRGVCREPCRVDHSAGAGQSNPHAQQHNSLPWLSRCRACGHVPGYPRRVLEFVRPTLIQM